MENRQVRVLLVEDDRDQIDWAIRQIGELCDLMVATTAIDASRKLSELQCQEDNRIFVISDLSIPGFIEEEEKQLVLNLNEEQAFDRKILRKKFLAEPDVRNGWKIFSKALEGCFYDDYCGVALVSNFEHHVQSQGLESFGDIYEGLYVLRTVAASFKYDDASFIKKKPGGLERVVVVADSLGVSWWPFFLKDGRVYSNSELQNLDLNPYEFCLNGAKMLKPYKEVFEYLFKQL